MIIKLIKNIDWKSYSLGLVIGIVVCFVVPSLFKWNITGVSVQQSASANFRNFQQSDEAIKSMAERMGMSEEDLKKEIDAGKNMKQIAEEKGVDMSAGELGRPDSNIPNGDAQLSESLENDNSQTEIKTEVLNPKTPSLAN